MLDCSDRNSCTGTSPGAVTARLFGWNHHGGGHPPTGTSSGAETFMETLFRGLGTLLNLFAQPNDTEAVTSFQTIFLVVFLAVLILDVDIGVGIGVAYAVMTVMFRLQKPKVRGLGRLPGTDLYKPLDVYTVVRG